MRAFAPAAVWLALAAVVVSPACGGKSDSEAAPPAPRVSAVPLPPSCVQARGATDAAQITTAAPVATGEPCGCEIEQARDFHPATLVEHPCAEGTACVNWKERLDPRAVVTAVAGTCAVGRVAHGGEECSQAKDPDPACVAGLTCVMDTNTAAHCVHVGELGEPCQRWFQCKSHICGGGHCTIGKIGDPCTTPDGNGCAPYSHLNCTDGVCVCAPGASCS